MITFGRNIHKLFLLFINDFLSIRCFQIQTLNQNLEIIPKNFLRIFIKDYFIKNDNSVVYQTLSPILLTIKDS